MEFLVHITIFLWQSSVLQVFSQNWLVIMILPIQSNICEFRNSISVEPLFVFLFKERTVWCNYWCNCNYLFFHMFLAYSINDEQHKMGFGCFWAIHGCRCQAQCDAWGLPLLLSFTYMYKTLKLDIISYFFT